MSYDRNAAVAYAHNWAYSRNPRYGNFDRLGGDCTNFVSQCLLAGGLKQDYTKDLGWYYNSMGDRAAAFTGVQFLRNWLTRKNIAREVSLSELQVGDVIQLSFDGFHFSHSLLVVQVPPPLSHMRLEDGILVATHTNDSDNRALSSYTYVRNRNLHINSEVGAR